MIFHYRALILLTLYYIMPLLKAENATLAIILLHLKFLWPQLETRNSNIFKHFQDKEKMKIFGERKLENKKITQHKLSLKKSDLVSVYCREGC
jgi:hypothetical protein